MSMSAGRRSGYCTVIGALNRYETVTAMPSITEVTADLMGAK